MSHACCFCNDTGSLSKLFHGDLDCVKCEVAEARVLLDQEYGMGQNTPLLRWQIFQRGRAYGKQEAKCKT